MSVTKILWGQILVVFAIVLATTWAATQWTAWRLGYRYAPPAMKFGFGACDHCRDHELACLIR
jgi:type IV secretory pathway TraG/TraD family ATPase VirD4